MIIPGFEMHRNHTALIFHVLKKEKKKCSRSRLTLIHLISTVLIIPHVCCFITISLSCFKEKELLNITSCLFKCL